MTDFAAVRELRPYLREPEAMRVGMPGKSGYLRLGFERDAAGRTILRDWERRAPLIVQQALYFDEELPGMPCIYILSSGGPNVDGDRYEQLVELKTGAMAHITTGAATKLASMRYNFSALRQRFRLDEEAYAEYLPEPVIPCARTRFWSETVLEVAPTATLVYAETYLSGRRFHGNERYAYDLLSVTTRIRRPGGAPLYNEKWLVEPGRRTPLQRGMLHDYEVFANVLVLTPPRHADAVRERTASFRSETQRLACGVLRLPGEAGLCCRVAGDSSEAVRQAVRHFCSVVRQEVKGRPLPSEFPWRAI